MELQKHKKQFEKIVNKYSLHEEEKAREISKFLTNKKNKKIDAKQFQTQFKFETQEEVKIFLSFITKGIHFKEYHLDEKK